MHVFTALNFVLEGLTLNIVSKDSSSKMLCNAENAYTNGCGNWAERALRI